MGVREIVKEILGKFADIIKGHHCNDDELIGITQATDAILAVFADETKFIDAMNQTLREQNIAGCKENAKLRAENKQLTEALIEIGKAIRNADIKTKLEGK